MQIVITTPEQSSFLPCPTFDLLKVWHFFLLPFYICVNLSVAALVVLALDLSH